MEVHIAWIIDACMISIILVYLFAQKLVWISPSDSNL